MLIDPQVELERLKQKDPPDLDVDTIKYLHGLYPDLKLYKNSNKYLYCSSAAVADTDDYSINMHDVGTHTCIYIWPYKKVNGHLMRSVPPFIKLAERNLKGFGFQPTDNWADILTTAGLSIKAIAQVRTYLSFRSAVNYLD